MSSSQEMIAAVAAPPIRLKNGEKVDSATHIEAAISAMVDAANMMKNASGLYIVPLRLTPEMAREHLAAFLQDVMAPQDDAAVPLKGFSSAPDVTL